MLFVVGGADRRVLGRGLGGGDGVAAGWPIVSGIVEGAARHLVADRLDITGSRWTVPGAEVVLTLRALIGRAYADL
ncbi:hypothetical protein [Streptomyces fulvoviolaceus]|uniref:hypothetical protein n=1 Tax=Streptomyces fulvoviolaceus TaxID=285535 RepID=UPI000B15AE90|nr:hypothetical protein [Streptomyces fulvoviolaceus]MCT9082119.1 hypothetical protein [Streptomyces fulvoviolaceus]